MVFVPSSRCVLQSDCARGEQPGQWLWSFDMEQQCLSIQDLNPSNVSREESRMVSLQHSYIVKWTSNRAKHSWRTSTSLYISLQRIEGRMREHNHNKNLFTSQNTVKVRPTYLLTVTNPRTHYQLSWKIFYMLAVGTVCVGNMTLWGVSRGGNL